MLKPDTDLYAQIYLAVVVLLMVRSDLKCLQIGDVMNDLVALDKDLDYVAYIKKAKRIINAEGNFNYLNSLTPQQLEARMFAQKRWLQNAIKNLPGYREKCNKRNGMWWRYQVDNKTMQWVRINLNKVYYRLQYKERQSSLGAIECKIHKCICYRRNERSNNHQMNGCQMTDKYTFHKKLCIPNDHYLIRRIKD